MLVKLYTHHRRTGAIDVYLFREPQIGAIDAKSSSGLTFFARQTNTEVDLYPLREATNLAFLDLVLTSQTHVSIYTGTLIILKFQISTYSL